mmetsp:Transcript_8835/g.19772  ORF Transcript_8835/g.19772 Transcript_8835/m.19772 type:complete len:661 (+) Transcript_8835:42-2024(+)
MPLLVCVCGADCGQNVDDEELQLNDGSGLALRIIRARNIPKLHRHTGGVKTSQARVAAEVYHKVDDKEKVLAHAKTHHIPEGMPAEWDEALNLGCATSYDLAQLRVRLTLEAKATREHVIGTVDVSMKDLIERPKAFFLVQNSLSNPVLGDEIPRMPCELEVAIEVDSMPKAWPVPTPEEPLPAKGYPFHIFMMTRGTRGDVQPFVALARGMAIQKGWLVTICTEVSFKDFIMKNASGVGEGKIQFRPSGGDTEKQVEAPISQWATNRKTEAMQLLILALSESNFFNTCSTFINEVSRLKEQGMPVNLLCTALTLTAVGCLCSEATGIPLTSFNLQPAGIPSADPEWQPVQAIQSHSYGFVDKFEEQLFTSHESLKMVKSAAEHNYFTRDNIKSLRAEYGLPDVVAWEVMKEQNIPIIIPMRPNTFKRPSDWWSNIILTDYIFLRNSAPGGKDLDEPVASFVEKAKKAGANLGLMTFSSMPVRRAAMLRCAVSMVKECKFNLRLIYVGKRQADVPDKALVAEAEGLTKEDRFLDVERADFGTLFNYIDVFVVHGGLGTTVEALRKKKPVAVTGPLLMDQRFWGDTVHKKGVGPEACHIDNFPARCVDYVNNALDPSDPMKWRANAAKSSWGAEADDGVKKNVDTFVKLVKKGLKPVQTKK